MGYLLFILFFLVWLNIRKCRQILIYISRGEPYPRSKISRILDIIGEVRTERKAEKSKKENACQQEQQDITKVDNAAE